QNYPSSPQDSIAPPISADKGDSRNPALIVDPESVRPLFMQLKQTTLVSHLSHLLRLTVMLSIVVFLIWSATLIRQATNTVQTSTIVSSTYQQIDATLAEEQASLYEYALNPRPTVRAKYRTATTTLTTLLHTLYYVSDTSDDPFHQ